MRTVRRRHPVDGDVFARERLPTGDEPLGPLGGIRYVQIDERGETATGHSTGVVTRLDDGRVRVEDEWEWESKPGSGESVLEGVDPTT